MQHIEDMSLAPQQRLHLIEVDGRTFLVHAGKGHAATFMPVDGTSKGQDQLPPATRRKGTTVEVKSTKEAPAKPKSAFAAAVAQARRNNPSLRLGK